MRVPPLEVWARQLSLEPGCVLQLVDHAHDDRAWTYLLIKLDYAADHALLLRLDYNSDDSRRPGTLSHEALEDLLDDLSSSKEGIHWRKL